MQYVAYYRVSTQKQGASGLGLEAQRAACARFNPIAEFIEVESGKDNDRKQLREAMEFAKASRAMLIVAKLDRLSRKASFILNLMDDGFRFRCADMENADEFQLHLYAILAQKERTMISERTKAALARAKERGAELGGSHSSKQERADTFAQSIQADIQTLMDSGITTPAAIASALNERAVRTSRGTQWGAGQVVRLLRRLGRK
ncbi:DNA invertase Pin-like site-specific DNA recombinase [Agrobacterium tumefaciens]|uniref:recombinase family protein n=1 Tax=Agrobacterium tumefaciens TaxID=358 RepID=UPI000DCFC08A|nr:recombinase family protein [Agrobacterium tumefaciens]MBP2510024.1 DNA invertase Pin-like site-specific DNA recombinase [Agrobacterium tumefaciens]MBP2519456.1 DNA invertase Pin-like site-specific DNA recombinase [Agrobacterium tumefaciens]MBP2578217.1 DNA invertase Pin-like site-specific DNA recombinase [Agrobacterium tumefaciens]MBP2596163.1 DNA invertase Pin-like site-specific DNA recombinase [Agrobacterium tumefaciens]